MWPGRHGRERPDHPAYVMAGSGEVVTYGRLDERSNRVAQLLHSAGLRFGDHIAILMENRAEYFEPCWAAQRSGITYTCINSHLTADEVAYIVDDCDARVLFTSDTLADIAAAIIDRTPKVERRLSVGPTPVPGHEVYETAIAEHPPTPLAEEIEGSRMLYSSGTTGRPKGVRYTAERRAVGEMPAEMGMMTGFWGFGPDTVYLSPAPLYHSAPLFYCMSTMRLGGTCIVLEHFDPEAALAAIERYGVTHSQWVPTMFVRMLGLPDAVRARYDLSSLRVAIHAAAPCRVEVKHRMIEWWGPIIDEYYSATEGIGATYISAADWLEHPGSVGRTLLAPIHILDDEGTELPPGEIGTVWFEAPPGRPGFSYHKDADKTREATDERGWSTVGDIGYLDADGFLYLTDRRSFTIVAGGVNIYPQEIEDLLAAHPAVADAAVFGIPDAELGERVHAVVQPQDWERAGPELADELLAHCRAHLSRQKCPRAIDFERTLPREDTGKLFKRRLRDRYWGDGPSRIV